MILEYCCHDANRCEKPDSDIRNRRRTATESPDIAGSRRKDVAPADIVEGGSHAPSQRRDKGLLHLSALVTLEYSLAFIIVAIIGACYLARGAWDLGFYLMGLGSFLILATLLFVTIRIMVESADKTQLPALGKGRRSLDLFAGRTLTLACGILSLAVGVFIFTDGQFPYYFEDSELRMQIKMLGGLSLLVGPLSFVGYILQFVRRHFTFSLVCTIAAAISAFWMIGILGAILGVSAVFFVAISKEEFSD